MASLLTSLLGGGGQVLDGVAHVIDSIKGKNPEEAAKLAERPFWGPPRWETD